MKGNSRHGAWAAGLLGVLAAPAAIAATPVIDGRIDPTEWAGARHVTDFRTTEPRTGEPGRLATEAWVLPTEDGLAVAFRNVQPADVPRMRERSARDQTTPTDRVAVTVDYQGAGRTALAFTLTLGGGVIDGTVVNENQYSTDWNGNWQNAIGEDGEAWIAEYLLPWHLAPLATEADGKRTIGIVLSRVIGSTGERVSWPAVHLSETRFVSQMGRLEVPAFSQSLFAVTPYGVALTDLNDDGTEFRAGVDLFWKPSGRFQLSATLNPDFGQVESDQLVVNFSAVETFFSDRRPFFTENQSLFDVPFGIANSRLLYTRRVGGNADDGEGIAEVHAAVKLNGSVGPMQYGLFAATEDDASGRDFIAARTVAEFGEHDIGAMLTRVDRPFLDRDAETLAIDHRWQRGDQIGIASTLVGSSISDGGARSDDFGVQTRIDQRLGERYRQQLYFLHMGDELDLNDFGYLDRNDLDYLRYEFGDRRTGFADDSKYASVDHRYAASTRHNTDGMGLYDALAWYRYAQLKDGGSEYSEMTLLSPANDDRILRGNGVARLPARLITYYQRDRPRKGDWALGANISTRNDGLDGIGSSGVSVAVYPTWYLNDAFNVSPQLAYEYLPDWVIWQGANLLGTYRSQQLNFNTNLNWIISPRSELRVKLETIALEARAKQGYRVGEDRRPRESDDAIADFSLRNLGFQVRYRYELAPLSDLYVVYSRGGFGFDEFRRPVFGLLGDAFSLRDNQQLLVKLSYRFG